MSRRELHESCSGSGEEQIRRFKSTCIGASFSRFFDLTVGIFACAHFRTSFLARARAHSRDVCRTCESKAMRRQFHDRSHVLFVVTLHQFSKSCYFSSQKHGFRFLAPCVALNFGNCHRHLCSSPREKQSSAGSANMCSGPSQEQGCAEQLARGRRTDFGISISRGEL